jgi:hypothetical protein
MPVTLKNLSRDARRKFWVSDLITKSAAAAVYPTDCFRKDTKIYLYKIHALFTSAVKTNDISLALGDYATSTTYFNDTTFVGGTISGPSAKGSTVSHDINKEVAAGVLPLLYKRQTAGGGKCYVIIEYEELDTEPNVI